MGRGFGWLRGTWLAGGLWLNGPRSGLVQWLALSVVVALASRSSIAFRSPIAIDLTR